MYSATKFILYTAGGSVFLLMAVLGLGVLWAILLKGPAW